MSKFNGFADRLHANGNTGLSAHVRAHGVNPETKVYLNRLGIKSADWAFAKHNIDKAATTVNATAGDYTKKILNKGHEVGQKVAAAAAAAATMAAATMAAAKYVPDTDSLVAYLKTIEAYQAPDDMSANQLIALFDKKSIVDKNEAMSRKAINTFFDNAKKTVSNFFILQKNTFENPTTTILDHLNITVHEIDDVAPVKRQNSDGDGYDYELSVKVTYMIDNVERKINFKSPGMSYNVAQSISEVFMPKQQKVTEYGDQCKWETYQKSKKYVKGSLTNKKGFRGSYGQAKNRFNKETTHIKRAFQIKQALNSFLPFSDNSKSICTNFPPNLQADRKEELRNLDINLLSMLNKVYKKEVDVSSYEVQVGDLMNSNPFQLDTDDNATNNFWVELLFDIREVYKKPQVEAAEAKRQQAEAAEAKRQQAEAAEAKRQQAEAERQQAARQQAEPPAEPEKIVTNWPKSAAAANNALGFLTVNNAAAAPAAPGVPDRQVLMKHLQWFVGGHVEGMEKAFTTSSFAFIHSKIEFYSKLYLTTGEFESLGEEQQINILKLLTQNSTYASHIQNIMGSESEIKIKAEKASRRYCSTIKPCIYKSIAKLEEELLHLARGGAGGRNRKRKSRKSRKSRKPIKSKKYTKSKLRKPRKSKKYTKSKLKKYKKSKNINLKKTKSRK